MQIECLTFLGNKKVVDSSDIFFRVSVYGVIIHNGDILLVKNKNNKRYSLPGGGVDDHEPFKGALKREVFEETGIAVEPKELVHFFENYFYYDPDREAMNSYPYFYNCIPKTFTLFKKHEVQDYEVELPFWMPLEELTPENFQLSDIGILKLLHTTYAF